MAESVQKASETIDKPAEESEASIQGEVQENPTENQPEGLATIFGEIFQTETLYKVAFGVLGMLILLCLITAFLLDPEMFDFFIVAKNPLATWKNRNRRKIGRTRCCSKPFSP